MAKKLNPEELAEDIQTHPERGLVDGKEILPGGNRTITISVSSELYRRFLLTCAAYDEGKQSGAKQALAHWVNNPNAIAAVENLLQSKMTEHELTRSEVIHKILGVFKAKARELRSRLTK